MEKTLTESEKIEQLLKPRWKVIALWPNTEWNVGDIAPPDYYVAKAEKFYNQYPHLFKRLQWWEERTPEEMPEYVKDEVTGKILKIEYRIDSHTPCEVKTWNEFEKPFWNILQDLLPATESEYNEYLTHSQAGER